MRPSRRQFLAVSGTLLPGTASAGLRGLKIGVTDWNLKQTGKLEAVDLANRLGFQGVQISLGRQVEGWQATTRQFGIDREISCMLLRNPRVPLDGTCLDVLHVNYLKNDKLGQRWVVDGIRLTKALGVKVMLLPFFGKGALETQPGKGLCRR